MASQGGRGRLQGIHREASFCPGPLATGRDGRCMPSLHFTGRWERGWGNKWEGQWDLSSWRVQCATWLTQALRTVRGYGNEKLSLHIGRGLVAAIS